MKKYFCLFFILAIFISGCKRYNYVIELRPKEEGIYRKVTWWEPTAGEAKMVISSFPSEKQKAFLELYPEIITTPEDKKQVFAGIFRGNTQNEMGGSFSYVKFPTQLGVVYVYIESFGGEADVATTIEQKQRAADKLVNHFIGWFEKEVGREPCFEKLHAFMDKELRQDIKNLILYLWLTGVASEDSERAEEQMLVRTCHYFYERGYLEPQQISLFARAFLYDGYQHEYNFMSFVRQFIARKMDLPNEESLPASFGFLSDWERAEESLRAYLTETAEFKELVRQREETGESLSDTEEIDSLEVVNGLIAEDLLSDIGFFDFFSSYDTIEINLVSQTRPFMTNGEWDEEQNEIVWLRDVGDNAQLPVVYYAFWSNPGSEFQKKHFGKIAVDGWKLWEYALWERGLLERDLREWNEFLATLSPGDSLRDKLGSFLFSFERQRYEVSEEKEWEGLEEIACDLILEGLEGECKTEEGLEKTKRSPSLY